MSPNDSAARHVVTAVIVAHDGAEWLPELASALREQTRPVDRFVAVDTGSRDRSGMLLASLLGSGSVFGAERGTGFGTAVAQALRHRAANAAVHYSQQSQPSQHGQYGQQGQYSQRGQQSQWGSEDVVEWVWLLHDDCAPDPEALECLLDAADATPGAAVLGPKVRDWYDRRVIIEAGVTIDGAGRRDTGLEPNELDQGQHDGDRDVLAVGSAGMLVRRDVWDRLGGFDRSFPMFRDDVDFCWRVISAGYRVRLVTDAVIRHLEASAGAERTVSGGGAAGGRPRRMDRRNALFVLLTNLPARPATIAVCRNVVGSLIRALVLLLGKQPGAAWDEISALSSVLSDPVRLLRGRRRRAPGRRRAYPYVRSLIPRGRMVGRFTEVVGTALAGSRQAAHARIEDDEEALLTDSGFAQRVLTNPGVLTVIGLTIIALVAERSVLRGGWLGGGALLPVSGGSAGLWREYFASFHDAGIGSTADAPPYIAVLALLSTVLGGKPWLAVDVVLLGCVPLAGATAYLATRRITTHNFARVWAAGSYALLPVATGAVAAGRIGTALAFALLPLIGILVGRIITQPPRRARQSAWAAGLVVAVVAAFVPLVWAVSVTAAVLACLIIGWRRRAMAINFGIVALVPAVLLVPWTRGLLTHPSLFLLEAGLQRPGLASPALRPSALFLLSPGGPGLPRVGVTVGLVLVGLAALLLNRRRTLVAAGWAIALFGLLVAIAVTRTKVTAPGGGPTGPAWPGVALTLAAAGLLLAGLTVAESLPALMRAGRMRRVGGAVVALIACSAPLLVAGTWVATGVRGPLKGTAASVLPEFVTASSANGLRVRTLVLRSGPGPLGYMVLRNADPLLGEPELAQPATGQGLLTSIVAGLASGSGGNLGDDGQALARFAIGYVLLPAPMNHDLIRVLDGTQGLRLVSLTETFGLWQVTSVAARVRVIEPNGTVVPVASGRVEVAGGQVPAAGGTLVLAEPADSRWRATLNGHALTPLASPVGGWAQGFTLPPGGGRLDISRSMLSRQVALGLEAVALLAVLVLALPSSRAQTVPAAEGQTAPSAGPARRAGRRKRGKSRSAGPSRSRRGRRASHTRPAATANTERSSAPSWAPPSASALTGAGAPGRGPAPPGAGAMPGAGGMPGAAQPPGAGDPPGAWAPPSPDDPRGPRLPAGPGARPPGTPRAGRVPPGAHRSGSTAIPGTHRAGPDGGQWPGPPGAQGSVAAGEQWPGSPGAFPPDTQAPDAPAHRANHRATHRATERAADKLGPDARELRR